ncbi:cytochrome d ubiquinol oxidase subunit II [Tahibacter soli]|jgi:cytochrome d ubiquinol oxidase subunit II|uniref:Cytochrome d ubiquinol oxidase subunit II n=1 Tax=Tahibacter soli TaxID=2983605 RepID=A0A9X3YJ68_9GAMM|nr:cytochrome d ubiquinol oxidase subunit II [Tahibacter soli]MDC8011828.1 cytochrome d ubiquinol oxidase subunit II [Tahibacter soli]
MTELFAYLMSYDTLRVIWWLFLGVLLIGFAVMDGFDLGVGTLLPFIAHDDDERRVAINAVGPTWEGNQVWFILGGGAIFAAFPLVYSAAFSGFFVALILVLFALILRPVGFDYRSKLPDPRWRGTWDWCLFIAGFVPSLVFGVAFGNLLQGVPLHYADDLRVHYDGGFFGLLNPFGLLCGVVSLAMLVMHGATFLQLKTVGVVRDRARRWLGIAALVYAVAFALAGVWLAFGIDGYRITQFAGPEGASNPLAKTAVREAGAWFTNYRAMPLLWVIPALGFAGAFLGWRWADKRPGRAFIATATSVAMTIATAGVAMFPFLMPSSFNPSHSLTVWDATSSQLTLRWMFWMTVIFLPLIIAYTSWVFRVMRGPVTIEDVRGSHTHY